MQHLAKIGLQNFDFKTCYQAGLQNMRFFYFVTKVSSKN